MRMIVALSMAVAMCRSLPAEDDAKLAAEFEALASGYQAALEAFFQPLKDARTPEEQSKVQIDWTKHPLKEWLPKVQNLAERARGTEGAIPILVWILTHAGEAGEAPKGIREGTLATLLDSHLSSPRLAQVPEAIHYYCAWSLGLPRAEEVLATIVEKSPHPSVRGAALFHAATMLMDDPEASEADRARAQGHFDRLLKEFGETEWAEQARGYVFELENLQVGKKAPDFEATDVEGTKFKLSDYRGKVVVVKFWGFW